MKHFKFFIWVVVIQLSEAFYFMNDTNWHLLGLIGIAPIGFFVMDYFNNN
jgi:hypothetical protein